jgi:hypothetical protein
MLAFKTFSQAPAAQVPPGIPLDYPWVFRLCTELEVESLKRDGWIITSQEAYDAHVSALEERYNAWQTALTQLGIESIVSDATRFGQGLLISFAAENVLMGITQEGKTGEVMDKLSAVLPAVQAGSLYLAIERIRAIPPSSYDTKYVTAARLLQFVNKIEGYLGMSLSTSL